MQRGAVFGVALLDQAGHDRQQHRNQQHGNGRRMGSHFGKERIVHQDIRANRVDAQAMRGQRRRSAWTVMSCAPECGFWTDMAQQVVFARGYGPFIGEATWESSIRSHTLRYAV
jgi:hypothetical protein